MSAGANGRGGSSGLAGDADASARTTTVNRQIAAPDHALPPGALADIERADRARAHEAAADGLAARGDWERAYRHLQAALHLSRPHRSDSDRLPDPLQNEVNRLRRERAEAREQSRRDALTSGYNRRYLDERLATLRGTDLETGCLALADVDHFKQINDTYGHGHGDEVLRRLATLIGADLPEGAFCARYGGEEFALVMPGVEPTDAVEVCEATRARIDRHGWDDVAPDLRVTISVGVACLGTHPEDVRSAVGRVPEPAAANGGPSARPARRDSTRLRRLGPGVTLEAADALLYVAKRAGRNAVAYRDPQHGDVRLAGVAAGRRGLAAAARAVFSTG